MFWSLTCPPQIYWRIQDHYDLYGCFPWASCCGIHLGAWILCCTWRNGICFSIVGLGWLHWGCMYLLTIENVPLVLFWRLCVLFWPRGLFLWRRYFRSQSSLHLEFQLWWDLECKSNLDVREKKFCISEVSVII